jgi:drug/metabolite transporter (DMT)-like permease
MPVFAIILLLGSAVLHTTWNFLLKQADEKYIATWWAVLLGSVVFLPFIFITGLPSRETWLYLLASVLLEVGYYIALSTAYRDADFSLVYPLARGAAPALIAIWSVLFLGERLTIGGVFGLGIIVFGLLVTGGSNLLQQGGEKPHLCGIALALTIALLISLYSTIDGAAVKRTSAFSYTALLFFLAPMLTSPLILRHYGWPTLKSELAAHRISVVSIGLLTVGSYLLALLAYSIAPLSYAAAIREISVVLGALVGWRFLGERMGGLRVTGAAIIFSGILIVALFG